MTLKEKLLDILELVNKEEQKFYASLDEKEKGVIGKLEQWSAKDIIAHNTYWKEHTIRNIIDTLHNENPSAQGDLNTINKEVFEANKICSWDDTLMRLERVYKSSIKCLKGIPDDRLTEPKTLPWQKGRLLWRIIAGNSYIHPITHIAEYYLRRGDSDYAIKLHEDVADFTKELSDSPEWLAVIKYNLACCYALFGKPKKAIEELSKALKLNSDLIELSRGDSDLDSIRKYNDYKSLY